MHFLQVVQRAAVEAQLKAGFGHAGVGFGGQGLQGLGCRGFIGLRGLFWVSMVVPYCLAGASG